MSDQTRIVELISSTGTTRVFELADGSYLKRSGGSASWRNNNLGNLKFEFAHSADATVHSRRTRAEALADAQRRYDGIIALDQRGNAIFETNEASRAAQIQHLLGAHASHTVERMVEGYSRADYSGPAHHSAQVQSIYRTADAEGIDLRGKVIGAMTPAELRALSDGICYFEGFIVGRAAFVDKPDLQAGPVASTQAPPGPAPRPATRPGAGRPALEPIERHDPAMDANATQGSPGSAEVQASGTSRANSPGQRESSARQRVREESQDATLHLGDHGPAVSTLQAQLNRLGYTDAQGRALSEDGRFGRRTRDALTAFQQASGLVASGHADARTQASLRVEDAKLPTSPAHPDHALFGQVLRQLRVARAARDMPPGGDDLRVAGALLVQMRRDGLQRADRVELSGDGARVRVVQVNAVRDEPALNRSSTALDVTVAMQQPLHSSSAQLAALASATPSLLPPVPRLGHAQAMHPH